MRCSDGMLSVFLYVCLFEILLFMVKFFQLHLYKHIYVSNQEVKSSFVSSSCNS